MIAATAEGIDLARLLLDLLIIVLAAKVGAELAERVHVPAVLGEIVAGVIIGPSVLNAIELGGERGVSIAVIAEIGVLLLLLQVGMEMDLAELGKVGRASMLVALIGVALPFAGGTIVGVSLGEDTKTAIFLGAALTATSVGITARVFGDLRALATTEARIVLGAAVADDVLGLVILTVVVKVVTGGSVGAGTISSTLGLAIAFLIGTGILGLLVVPKLLDLVHRYASSGATLVVAAFGITLAFAELADAAKLAFIIGAFMAGLGLGRSRHHEHIAQDLGAIGNLFIPVFFVQIGVNADLDAMFKPKVLGLAGLMLVVGVAGKLAAAWGAAGTRTDRVLIGIGMVPRGEVGLIFASIGLANGVLDADLYGALLVVVLVTTLMTPPLLRLRVGSRPQAVDEGAEAVEPEGGWLEVINDQVRLRETPPVVQTVPIALRTAGLLRNARPSDELLDWFGRHRGAPLEWSPDATGPLIELLRDPDVRAWRFLDATAVLERSLPELAIAMRRRRADIRDLDPIGALRFPVVEALQDLPIDGDDHSEVLMLAALAADACSDTVSDRSCAVALATRLGRGEESERIGQLLADAHLLRAGVRDLDAFDEHQLLQLATHLASVSHLRQAYTLAVALGDLSKWQRESLDERFHLLLQALDHPELIGGEATNLAGARLQAATRLAATPETAERLRHASASYLLAHDPEELARQARLVEPLARAGVVRVAVTPDPEPDRWRVDVACRDIPGLLARLTEALTDSDLDIISAAIATWPDGAVLDAFVVRSAERPRARELAERMERALREPLEPAAMPDLQLTFDNASHPWHTACLVQGEDRPGALHAVSAAFAAAGVIVHTARIASSGGMIADRFTLSDRLGRKLDDTTTERVRKALSGERTRRFLRR